MTYSKAWKKKYGSELQRMRLSGDKHRLRDIIGDGPAGYSKDPESLVIEAMHKKKEKRAKLGSAIKGMQRSVMTNFASEG